MQIEMMRQIGASFRDPSGFLFTRDDVLYRQVNHIYAGDYTRLMESGLYDRLTKAGLLIQHAEVKAKPADSEKAFRILQPERVPFISYPYEWSFGQLKAAALATLSIQKRALKADMSLKDASAYNIQFLHGQPILIDTLSFEIFKEGDPWVAYRQFCQHFLAPLALMAYRDVRLSQLLRVYIDGIPLDMTSLLLPSRTRWNFGLLTHIHWHANAQKRYADVSLEQARAGRRIGKEALLNILESLESTVRKLAWKPGGTEWADYYDITNYTDAAFKNKKEIIAEWLEQIAPKTIWDLGANSGLFSRIAAEKGAYTVAFDIDPAAVEQNYQQVKSAKEQNLLPLVLDLTNPSPAIGWANSERDSLKERGPADVIMALALIHHLAISNNVPLDRLAAFFSDLCTWLIVEWIPKSDSQVRKLLRSREDIFSEYTQEEFVKSFGKYYKMDKAIQIQESERWLFCMKKGY